MAVGFPHLRRIASLFWPALLLLSFAAVSAQTGVDDIDRAEVAGWADADAGLAMLERAQPLIQSDEAMVQLLTVRGMLFVDKRQDRDARQIAQRLEAMGDRGLAAAASSAHFVRAYLLNQSDDIEAARRELEGVKAGAADPALERFRLEILRGSVLAFVGEQEAAMHSFEVALDTAREMRSVPRELRALQAQVDFQVRIGNLERAVQLLAKGRELAVGVGDESALASSSLEAARIADSRGDREGERRETLEALGHARKSGNNQLLSVALASVADSYLKAGDYRSSLRYSEECLPLARTVRRNGLEQTIIFNIGIAKIGLNDIVEGKRRAESAIEVTIAGGNVSDAEGMLREYGQALERIGDWRAALDVYHRSDEMREQLMDISRQRSLLALTAKFEDERKTREIELLRRDNALKGANLEAQHMRQVMTMMGAAVVVLLAFGLGWAFTRVRKAHEVLKHASEHDTLTGVRNRRYFNDKVLARHVDRRFNGCALLIDLDHFKRINDIFGHPGGDAVLQAVARRLADSLRDHDTLVRWGGEEFLAVLPPMSREELTMTVRRLLGVVQDKPVLWRTHVIPCTISVGYAAFPVGANGADVSLDRAIALVDKALYEAKKRGRNRGCMITAIKAGADGDLTSINAAFEVATADNVVQLREVEARA